MKTNYIVKCEGCDNILIDNDPRIEAVKKEVSDVKGELIQLLDGDTYYWGCPHCQTDIFLRDI